MSLGEDASLEARSFGGVPARLRRNVRAGQQGGVQSIAGEATERKELLHSTLCVENGWGFESGSAGRARAPEVRWNE